MKTIKTNHPPSLFLPYEILSDTRLTLRQIRVIMALFSWRKTNTNTSRVSREKLSEITNYPISRISNITAELVKLGWLIKHGNGGKSQWIRYEIQELNGDCFGNGDQNGNGDRIGSQTVTESVTQTVTESVTPIDTVTKTVTDSNIYDHFSSFWECYPKKVGKDAALKAFKKLTTKERKQAFQNIVGRYQETPKQFIPNPATYLNGKRWHDEIITQRSGGKNEINSATDNSVRHYGETDEGFLSNMP